MFNWLFGNARNEAADLSLENQQPTIRWACECGYPNEQLRLNSNGRCAICRKVEPSAVTKPHYKWSWKLNKAVRL